MNGINTVRDAWNGDGLTGIIVNTDSFVRLFPVLEALLYEEHGLPTDGVHVISLHEAGECLF